MTQEKRWGKGGRYDDPIEARNYILAATYKVVTRKGIDKTTIAEIAKQAKVSRPTVYRYFDSRDEIIQCLMLRRQDDFFDGMYEATKPFRNDFPRLVEECLCYAYAFNAHDASGDLVSGPNAGRINNYFHDSRTAQHWSRLLDEPYRLYRQETGNVADLESLKGFLGLMILTVRLYPPRNQETLRNQLQAIMTLGQTIRKTTPTAR
jgi:AcrR family transcriptional regulator